MLESLRPDLVAHQGSPTKDPALRLETIRAAGELRIPFTSGILVGIGETEQDRVEALEALAALHAEHGHLQEVILQNFVPHRRYYGEEPAEIAEEAQRDGRRGRAGGAPRVGHRGHARPHARARARVPAADAGRGHPDPAEPVGLVAAARGRGRHRPGRAVRERRPHLARASVPVGARDAQAARPARGGALRAPVRLPAVHEPGLARAGSARRDQGEVLVVHPARQLGAPRGAHDQGRPRAGRDRRARSRAARSARTS